jgi:hypothetical protein
MTKTSLFGAVVLAAVSLLPKICMAQALAATPPMGWNSWDSYGFTINEEQFRANAQVLASLEQYGWKYAVIDEGWYMANPDGKTLQQKEYLWNSNGLLIPDSSRFPSAEKGAGFRPLADWLHKQGLKFGIHIVRGIPRQVVAANLPIAGTRFFAADAADTNSPCPWDEGNWGIKDNAAGQAYYDSMMKLYASWGVDFLKVDCISDHPYRPTEIRQIAAAIKKTGRPIVLSLSPGPTDFSHAAEIAEYAQMWRISNDHWDQWEFDRHTPDGFPFGLRGAFDLIAEWFTYTSPGNWPDADMLPEGWLGPHPGWGEPRQSRLTQDEQRTEFTLWSIARSPLIFGGNLTRLDAFSRSLMTNQILLFVNQNSNYSHPVDVSALGPGFENIRVWRGTVGAQGDRGYAEYIAFFNLGSGPAAVHVAWKSLGLEDRKYIAENAFDDSLSKESKDVSLTLPSHGCTLFQLR